MPYIYCVTNIVNGMKYIGSSKSNDMRTVWQLHVSSSYSRYGTKSLWNSAIKEFGPHVFKLKVLAEVDDTEVTEVKNRYIEDLNTMWPNGYNSVSTNKRVSKRGEDKRLKGTDGSSQVVQITSPDGYPIAAYFSDVKSACEWLRFNNIHEPLESIIEAATLAAESGGEAFGYTWEYK